MTVLEPEVIKAVGAHVPPAFIRNALKRAARVPEIAARLPEGTSTLAVRITDDDEMFELNRSYAGEDHPTDVLSFEGSDDYLGDIAISWPAVVRQAQGYGHDAWTECALLAVHGLLHLLGWDHETEGEAKEMWRLMQAAFRQARLKPAPRSIGYSSGYTPVRGLRRSPRA